MFTLNELYFASMARTTALLLALGDVMCKGAVLVVADSPGSYASVRLGGHGGDGKGKGGQAGGEGKAGGESKREKRYPMKWLLDHTLLELAGRDGGEGKREEGRERSDRGREGGGRKWEKVVDEESRWFRWERKGLTYPAGLELEDMRFQLHVYRRL